MDELEDNEALEVVAQTTTKLPFLDDQVPVLSLSDGRLYIPVFAVCRVFGIRPDIHIRRWRRLVLWVSARKLLFQSEKRGKRLVWCLLISQVPFLYSLFDWKLVAPERQLQLHRATEVQIKLADQAYQQMQYEYKAMRQALFTFITTFANIDTLLMRYEEVFGSRLDSGSAAMLTELCERGRSLPFPCRYFLSCRRKTVSASSHSWGSSRLGNRRSPHFGMSGGCGLISVSRHSGQTTASHERMGNGRHDLRAAYLPDRSLLERSDQTRNWCNEDCRNAQERSLYQRDLWKMNLI